MRTCRSDGLLLKPDVPAMPLDAFWLGSAFCNGAQAQARAQAQAPGHDQGPGPGEAQGRGRATTGVRACPVAVPAQGEVWATATRIGPSMVWPIVFAQLAAPFRLRLPDVFAHLRGVPSVHRDGNVAPAAWQPPVHGWVLYRPGAPLAMQPPTLVGANGQLDLAQGRSARRGSTWLCPRLSPRLLQSGAARRGYKAVLGGGTLLVRGASGAGWVTGHAYAGQSVRAVCCL